jgi:hypothetical protein
VLIKRQKTAVLSYISTKREAKKSLTTNGSDKPAPARDPTPRLLLKKMSALFTRSKDGKTQYTIVNSDCIKDGTTITKETSETDWRVERRGLTTQYTIVN